MKRIKLAYIGGGSKEWAHVFMNDLALSEGITGEIALYDIDLLAAKRNQEIGDLLCGLPEAKTKWEYRVYETIEPALRGADFVVMSILPATFKEMASDVHEPEAYGIYQTVGDTTGPGGILRSMRTVPIYEEFARKIKEFCPDAWVLNFTNPMNLCVRTLHDVFRKSRPSVAAMRSSMPRISSATCWRKQPESKRRAGRSRRMSRASIISLGLRKQAIKTWICFRSWMNSF